ncbi:hypothetical protein FDB23_11685 [Clostridium botulinum]|nr:hypothetical protein [Clostridium botulinum]
MENNNYSIRDDKIWIFNTGNSFNGNPKWLYIYINKYRKDIDAYWFCNDINNVKFIRKLGYKAYTYKSKKGQDIQEKAGVFVVNQVKEVMPQRLIGAKILNLWHGVGCKSIERKLNSGILYERVAKKYVRYNEIYTKNQLFLVTSELMEKHFKEQCGLNDNQVIRAGYPCCMKDNSVHTFDHNILKAKKMPLDAKIAVYAPTFRENSMVDFFGKAIPDMDILIEKLNKNNILLIFKVHPLMERDYQYNNLKKYYKNCSNLLFWDNHNDIYEIFDKIDLAIVDYSSIFYDMLAAGVPHFVRYLFDYDNKENIRDLVFDYKEMTVGNICNTFDDLLKILDDYTMKDSEDYERVKNLFWSYTNENSYEHIIKETLKFNTSINNIDLPTLYSFDIFDTLIERKTLLPIGIFYYVKEKLYNSEIEISKYIIDNFVQIRREAESNLREYYKKTINTRKSEKVEITFDEIYERIADVYNLGQKEIAFMKQCELDAEYENCIARPEMVSTVIDMINRGEKVILISDMYLPKKIIKDILKKENEKLAELPLYISCEYGVQKLNRKLFLEVYKTNDYNYKEWIHYGDNKISDGKQAKQLGIKPIIHPILKFNNYENNLINNINTYDSYLFSTMLAKFREKHNNITETQYYAYAYASLYFVPYVSWSIKHALSNGIECLYFISRDGYHLKRIADEILKAKGLKLKTKYIYGSRKAWRVPSFINKVDDEFFGDFGNFTGVSNFKNLLDSLVIDEKNFKNIFPELHFVINEKHIDKKTLMLIITTAKNSEKYNKYLLENAKEKRQIVRKYLKQEINFEEKFAFVEYWGRGYTQDCLARLLNDVTGKDIDTIFYYVRSIYPTQGKIIRYNYSTNVQSLIFVEAIFANLPYESVKEYCIEDNKIKPVLKCRDNCEELHSALETYLVEFCKEFYKLNFIEENVIERELFRFSLQYYSIYQGNKCIASNLGHLKYTETLYDKESEFAPAITWKTIYNRIFKGENFKPTTKSLTMSLARTSKSIIKIYRFKKDVLDKNKILVKIKKRYEWFKKKVKLMIR